MSKCFLALRWLAAAFATRHYYRSLRDALKVTRLQIALTGWGKSWLGPRDVFVGLRALPRPVLLRQSKFDVYSMLEIFLWNEYGFVAESGLPEDARIVDLGANIGLASLYFSTLQPRSKLLAVEPDVENRRVLEANCRDLIDSGRMEVVGAFVAAHDGSATIDRSRGTLGYRMAAGSAIDSKPEDAIACVAIDKLLLRFLGDRNTLDVLKCDVEGAERELFSDCAAWIGRVSRLAVETHAPYQLATLYQDLRRNHWEFDIHSETVRAASNGITGVCVLCRRASESTTG